MKIAVLGSGRMGREVEIAAAKRGHNISAVFDIDNPLTASSDLNGAEVLIDFTLAPAVIENLKNAAKLGVPVVEGTTGWDNQLEVLKTIDNLTVIYSPNFSIGVYQFTRLIEAAAKLFGPLEEYDCYLHEWHHTGKADSPSGTAKKLASLLLEHLPGKTEALYETSFARIAPHQLHVTSTRVGAIPGTHEVGFESVGDSIQLKHRAHGREGFAQGAVRAAEWIIGRRGVYTMDDFMRSLTDSKK
jgi:4-hydroxy-tetrahydrodipicolinate reductase